MSVDKIPTLFLGSGEFGIKIISSLLKLDFLILKAVITQPDKPTGRKQLLTPTPVKEYILRNSLAIDILQPSKIKKESKEVLKKYSPELIIVASYGQIIPKLILDFPKYHCLNLHGSILPKLRGAVPVQMSILNGFIESGVTLQRMVKAMDEGPIISTRNIKIKDNWTSEDLMSELSNLAAQIISNDLIKWVEGEIKETPQEDFLSSYCYKEDLNKDKAEIKLDISINIAERMIRGFYPWPVAWIRLENGKTLKIYKAERSKLELQIERDKKEVKSFNIIRSGKKLFISFLDGFLELKEVQLEGKKKDIASNYLFLAR